LNITTIFHKQIPKKLLFQIIALFHVEIS